MTEEQHHALLLELIKAQAKHFTDLVEDIKDDIGDIKGHIKEVREENANDHQLVMEELNKVKKNVEELQIDNRDQDVVARERDRFRRSLVAWVLGANAIVGPTVFLVVERAITGSWG